MAEQEERAFLEWLNKKMDEDADYVSALFPDRPYEGQEHTDHGTRGSQHIHGVTFRDLRDCYIIGAFQASGLRPEEYPGSVYSLPWDNMDPIAVAQQMACALEKRMGIYPNISLMHVHQQKDPRAEIKRLTSALERIHELLDQMQVEGINNSLKEEASQVFWSVR